MHVPVIDFNNCLGFDLETWGTKQEYALQPFRALTGDAGIRAASFARRGQASGLLNPSKTSLESVLTKAADQSLYVVGWNVSFDAAWLIAVDLEDLVFRIKWLDAMLLWRHAVVEPEGEDIPKQKRKSYALKAAMLEYFPDEAGFKDFEDFQATDEASLIELMRRNKGDALFTLKLAEMFWSLLTDAQRNAALIEARCIPQVAKTKVLGLRANKEAAQALSEILEAQRVKLNADLLEVSPEAEGVNFGSPKQLQALLYQTWGLPCNRFSKKTADPSTDKYALFDLAFLDPRAKMLKELREAKNNRTKYAEATLKSLAYNGDGFVRPGARIFSTYCVPGSVEVLTRTGWVSLKDWTGGEIVQAYTDGSLEFLPATRFDGPITDDWVVMTPLDCQFTEGHTIPYLAQKTQRWSTKLAGEIYQKSGSSFDVPVAGRLEGLSGALTPIQMQIICMSQADGWFSKDGFLKFTFKKARKIDRARTLFKQAGIVYRERVWPSYPDRTELIVSKKDLPLWLSPSCKILGSWLLDTTFEGIAAFVAETVYWDGSPHTDGGTGYFSINRENLKWVSTLAHLTGQKAGIQKHNKVHVSNSRAVRTIRGVRHCTLNTELKKSFCAVTQTGFWLARSNETIFITGNTSRMTYSSSDKATVVEEKTTKAKGLHVVERKVEVPTGIALHQWKRGKEFRRIIQAPEGYDLVELDFAGQEFGWMAVASGDETMLELRAPGEDAHSFMGAQIAEIDYKELIRRVHDEDPEASLQRKLGKFANLSFQYRVSAKTATVKARVDYELNVEETFIGQILGKYKLAYPGVPAYWKTQILKCKQLGYAETYAGRRVQLGGSWAGRDAWPMESTAINYPIQGTGGDQKYLALAVARNELPKWGGYFYYELHDGLFFIFPTAVAEAAARHFKKILSNLPYKGAWGVNLPIDFPVDAKLGASWGDLKDVKG